MLRDTSDTLEVEWDCLEGGIAQFVTRAALPQKRTPLRSIHSRERLVGAVPDLRA